MLNSKQQLGELIKAHREEKGIGQEALAKSIRGANRSNIAHLEQGLRLPKPDLLSAICGELQIPRQFWQPFLDEDIQQRLEFEETLSELAGISVSLDGHDPATGVVTNKQIKELFNTNHSEQQACDLLNSILVVYGVRPMSADFFGRYLAANSFSSLNRFSEDVKKYQKDAVRLFSNLEQAYERLSRTADLKALLAPIQPRAIEGYTNRSDWSVVNEIADKDLPNLGYISAARVKQEAAERQALQGFLKELAGKIKDKGVGAAIAEVPEKTKRRMDSFLRKFQAIFEHGLFSPLFAPDPDELEREAQRLAPKSDAELATMGAIQQKALENLAGYLASDFIDVYVATSMRSDADYVSVNHFVRGLFMHEHVRPLRLRYFNPTQSWIDDRIAKGLVEALMLRRASVTVYMAQKSDTFGKDSEASVSLGQGKPVIVYVPRLTFPDGSFDTEVVFIKSRSDLIAMLNSDDKDDIDDAVDEQAIFGKLLTRRLEQLTEAHWLELIRAHWADFDLRSEAERIQDLTLRASYRQWLDKCIEENIFGGNWVDIKSHVIGIFVANAITFENRARLFRERHPLALQVILSSGVLNGILVVRSVAQCGDILAKLIENDLDLDLQKDEMNYRLVERITKSTLRVISRHRLLSNAFQTFYSYD